MNGSVEPDDLPSAAGDVARQHPELWSAFQELGRQAAGAGPLTERERFLVGLALSISAGSEGATHSHARRGLTAGLAAAELEHVALLSITTVGWPQAIKGLTWIRDVTR
jgi:alkylhydroperoxidase/carboxymuconolactone decarboxylase family protein YurZ